MIDPATIERIKNTADIVEVVGDYVHLIRRGSNYMGLCPFHNERTPSFSVNKQRNFCYCFSCKKGGSPVNFIMEKEGLSYHEALLHLAKKYGIEVHERELTDEERARQSEREAMLVANEWAMQKMESDLHNTEEGRDIGLSYFTQRGVTDAAMKAFHLGYAIDNGSHLVSEARKAGYRLDVLKQLGLIGTSQQGRDYDRFRGRVIFPILNTAGKVIAFGGRDLKGGLAKYINSPESTLYKKSNELYGIYQAKSSIVSEGKCYLVEGYMDVIGMWQAGMKNVVASSGTALTDGQIAMIHRFTDKITLIYDGDKAGIKASLRGIDMLLSHKLDVKVLLLPDGHDPDSFAKEHTPEEFRQYVAENETDIIRYKAKVLLSEAANDPRKRIDAVNSVVESIAHIPDPISRDVYVQECSSILGIPDTSVAKSVARARAALIDKMKRERQWKQAAATPGTTSTTTPPAANAGNGANSENAANGATAQPPTPGEGSGSTPGATTGESQAPHQGGNVTAILTKEKYPLYPLEREALKYCVRYAYLPLFDGSDENGEEYSVDVHEFMANELEADSITFSVPVFKRIFEILDEMRPAFEAFRNNIESELRGKIDARRREGIERIGSADLSVAEIQREEKKMEEELQQEYEAALCERIKDYPGRVLASHQDKGVRDTAFQLLYEKHQLSNIYQKGGNTELEEDRLDMLVPRVITEWKNEIVSQRIKTLFQEFHQATTQNDREQEQALQAELASLMELRKKLAKVIGDRILDNRRNK